VNLILRRGEHPLMLGVTEIERLVGGVDVTNQFAYRMKASFDWIHTR